MCMCVYVCALLCLVPVLVAFMRLDSSHVSFHSFDRCRPARYLARTHHWHTWSHNTQRSANYAWTHTFSFCSCLTCTYGLCDHSTDHCVSALLLCRAVSCVSSALSCDIDSALTDHKWHYPNLAQLTKTGKEQSVDTIAHNGTCQRSHIHYEVAATPMARMSFVHDVVFATCHRSVSDQLMLSAVCCLLFAVCCLCVLSAFCVHSEIGLV